VAAALAGRAHHRAGCRRRGRRRNVDDHDPVPDAQHRTGRTADLPARAGRLLMMYSCCDKLRRDAVAADPVLNGIDYLEVIDHDLPDSDPLRQRTLLVHCLKPLAAGSYDDKVRILGGERIKNVAVQWAAPASPLPTQLTAADEAATAAIVSA